MTQLGLGVRASICTNSWVFSDSRDISNGILPRCRKELADSAGVPPYVIFSDKTLAEMAVYFPQGREALLKINGVGEVKNARYGEAFIAIIKEYCGSKAIQELERMPLRVADQDAARRYVAVGAAYNAGESLAGLMKRFAVSADTIVNHLLRYVMAGNLLRSAEDLIAISKLSPDQQQQVCAAFEELGSDKMKPVFERLGGSVNYEELKLLRLCYLCGKKLVFTAMNDI
jgi:ATP-dependent DNA helicase RecQ